MTNKQLEREIMILRNEIKKVTDLTFKVIRIESFLGSELGYKNETIGNVNRNFEKVFDDYKKSSSKIEKIFENLNGEGDKSFKNAIHQIQTQYKLLQKDWENLKELVNEQKNEAIDKKKQTRKINAALIAGVIGLCFWLIRFFFESSYKNDTKIEQQNDPAKVGVDTIKEKAKEGENDVFGF